MCFCPDNPACLIWHCTNGNDVKSFEWFTEMMDFLISSEGNGWWAL